MKKSLLFGMLILVFTLSSALDACKTSTTETTTSTAVLTSTTNSTIAATTKSPTTTNAKQSNWWDKFGKPQYGGEINIAFSRIVANFDNYTFIGSDVDYWYESLFEPDWTLDRKTWDMGLQFTPDQYWKGLIAESWEMNDPQTITVKIKQGVKWQNKAPVNGREFTAYDIQSHYNRLLGTGDGYTWRDPIFSGQASSWEKVTATDKYTVVFKFNIPCGGTAFQNIADRWALNEFEAPEWVALGGPPVSPDAKSSSTTAGASPLTDWKQVVGTGPWMLTDFITGSTMKFDKNLDYWGYDPRYPENKTPYADNLNVIAIPDSTTQIAALRTGKIDILTGIDWKQAKSLESTNPELLKIAGAASGGGVMFKNQTKPFDNLKVREAMQMAVDRNTLAATLFNAPESKPAGLFSQTMKGYCYSYGDWPQELKDQYTYNPAAAKQLLVEAGYPDGFKTNVVVSAAATSAIELLQAYKDMFSNIGIDMEIRAMEQTQAEMYLKAGKHDAMSSGAGGMAVPPTMAIDMFYSKSSQNPITGTNDPVYDAARDKYFAAANAAEAAKACIECDKRVIEQHWMVSVLGGSTYTFYQTYFKGFSNEVIRWGGGVVCSRLWIDKSAK